MPKITINETDLTSAGVSQVDTNVVFIPGYANIGPVNTPTLCETEDEFKSTFGDTPYTFRTTHTITDKNGLTLESVEGSYERSYVYALETVRRGMSVVYSRIFNTANKTKYTPTATIDAYTGDTAVNLCTITSTQPGAYYTNINYEFTPEVSGSSPASLKVWLEDASGEEITSTEEKVYIVFTSADLKTYSEYSPVLYSNINSSLELVSIEWVNDTISSLSNYTLKEAKGNLALNDASAAKEDEFVPSDIYTNLQAQLDLIEDRNKYQIEFITSGGYPVFNYNTTNISDLDTVMMTAAQNRGDSVAIIDSFPDETGTILDLQKQVIRRSYGTLGIYGAMFAPAGYYSCTSVSSKMIMPASFGYITTYATSIQNNAGWLAAAGATRGVVTNLISNIGPSITQSMIDTVQSRTSVSINPITEIKPYGNLIWGNRTLKNNSIKGNLTAQSFLNIRCLLCELKKIIYSTAKGLTFEQNNDILWINFKAGIVPTLEQMVTGSGLSGYELKKVKSTEKGTLKAKIILYAIEAVEDFDIDIELSDSEVTTVE